MASRLWLFRFSFVVSVSKLRLRGFSIAVSNIRLSSARLWHRSFDSIASALLLGLRCFRFATPPLASRLRVRLFYLCGFCFATSTFRLRLCGAALASRIWLGKLSETLVRFVIAAVVVGVGCAGVQLHDCSFASSRCGFSFAPSILRLWHRGLGFVTWISRLRLRAFGFGLMAFALQLQFHDFDFDSRLQVFGFAAAPRKPFLSASASQLRLRGFDFAASSS